MAVPVIGPHALAAAPDGAAAVPRAQPPAASPGAAFAEAVASRPPGSDDVVVDLAMSLPLAFPLFAARPRYTVRHLLPVLAADGDHVPYLHEPPAAGEAAERSGTTYAASHEASLRAVVANLALTEVSVAVPAPDGLTGLPDLLAAFVDRRVVVRLCTVENEVLLRGSADGRLPGLLRLPGARRTQGRGDLVTDVARAAAFVEDTGGSCDGMVVHPDVYWALAASGALERFNTAGVRVARTRMIDRACALLGDFRAAATLIDPARARLRLFRDRADAGSLMIQASMRIGLAIHLPQHFLTLSLH